MKNNIAKCAQISASRPNVARCLDGLVQLCLDRGTALVSTKPIFCVSTESRPLDGLECESNLLYIRLSNLFFGLATPKETCSRFK